MKQEEVSVNNILLIQIQYMLDSARALNKLGRYHTRPSQFNWGPENLHFGKTHFKDQAQLFYVLNFSLQYLKTAQKLSKFEKRRKITKIISPIFGDPI